VEEAGKAFEKAARLTESNPVRTYLMARSSAAAHSKISDA